MCWLTSIVNSRRNWGPKDSHPTGNLPSWGAHSAGTGTVLDSPSSFARRLRSPNTWATRMPMVMKSWGITPRAPLRFLGDSSPRYIGTTLEETPGRRIQIKM